MKATQEGQTIGFALAPFDGTAGTSTTVAIYDKTNDVTEYREVVTGEVLVFINLGWNHIDTQLAQGAVTNTEIWLVDQASGRLKAPYALDLLGQGIYNIKELTSASGNWSLDENGTLTVKKVNADEVATKKLEVGSRDKPSGITLYDSANGEPYCLKVVNGAITSIPGSCIEQAISTSFYQPASPSSQNASKGTAPPLEETTLPPSEETTPPPDPTTTEPSPIDTSPDSNQSEPPPEGEITQQPPDSPAITSVEEEPPLDEPPQA